MIAPLNIDSALVVIDQFLNHSSTNINPHYVALAVAILKNVVLEETNRAELTKAHPKIIALNSLLIKQPQIEQELNIQGLKDDVEELSQQIREWLNEQSANPEMPCE